ncbi:kinase-like domain-containing protein [Glomus cerebriforme]|uniref:Kinase-like domain-containing protein n=1 Tax=Glomus cerebriforme TaxID=658196 RepID=A0A397SCU3_9GLOM|nr:kinase-like domain-containing protein [Glomus cerebriforme]
METLRPDKIVEWIPYNNLQNIKYKTKGGFSEIYTADWINGSYEEWNSKEKRLKRNGRCKVILKRLENVERANRSWLEEAKSHLAISNKWNEIVGCFGLTQDPSDKSYMLVVYLMDMDLRKYLQQHHSKLTWEKRFEIINSIVNALSVIHNENAIHRDLHSKNILCYQHINFWNIGDFGFCGPVDKPLNSIYGNLPYIAPEVIVKKETTFASDIYSIGMLMWEISSGQPPFANFNHDYYLAMNIVNGMRPKIVPGTPLEYKILMEQCWDAISSKRPDIYALCDKIYQLKKSYNFNEIEERNTYIYNSQLNADFSTNYSSINSSIRNLSKVHIFEDLPEPKNASEGKLP